MFMLIGQSTEFNTKSSAVKRTQLHSTKIAIYLLLMAEYVWGNVKCILFVNKNVWMCLACIRKKAKRINKQCLT